MNTTAGLKIGIVEINRFHLLRAFYVICLIGVGIGLYATTSLLDVDKRAAEVNAAIEEQIAETQARLETIQGEADAIIGRATQEAARIKQEAEAEAAATKAAIRRAAMAANGELISQGQDLSRLIAEARSAYENILRQGIQDAADPAELRKWENLLENYRRKFPEAPLRQWQERFEAIQTQIETTKTQPTEPE